MEEIIAENISEIKEKIYQAALKSGRRSEDITLVAVSKTCGVEYILAAYKSGLKIFGESKIQEALIKIDELKNYNDITFHFIGNIQSNKVKYFTNHFKLIHSVDRIKIAELINEKCMKSNIYQDILVQVNLVKEKQKGGVYVEALDELLLNIKHLHFLRVRGLMFIPPYKDNPEDNRENFKNMYKLFSYHRNIYKNDFKYLSMGMSDDFDIAIEEGSNMVRIGTKIFGHRKSTK